MKKTTMISLAVIICFSVCLMPETGNPSGSKRGRVLSLHKDWQISEDDQERFYLKYPYHLKMDQKGSLFVQDENPVIVAYTITNL